MRREVKQPRWDTAQSILHEDDRKNREVKNAYGSLEYIKEEKGQRDAKEGFVLKALEAPGTPPHTYHEKHLDLAEMKKIRTKKNQFLYASGVPFQSQAIFYDVKGKKRGADFLACMKQMLKEGRYPTLQDTFGFLCQDSDRLLMQNLERERLRELTLEEFDIVNKQIDLLNDRLRKKEAKERQLCGRLQLMLNRREEKETGKEEHVNWERNKNLSEVSSISKVEETENKEGDDENSEGKDKKMM